MANHKGKACSFVRRMGYADGGGVADPNAKQATTDAMQTSVDAPAGPAPPKPAANGGFLRGVKDAARFFSTSGKPDLRMGGSR